MGLIVDIFRTDYDSTHNAFHGRKSVTVVNIDGPFEPTEERPAARLTQNAHGDPIIVPLILRKGGVTMFGGTYAATSDSRFSRAVKQYGAIAIHDRFEDWETYEAMSR